MEPMMTDLKVLSIAAAMVLALPVAAPTASFAQGHPIAGSAGGGGPRIGGGGAPGPRFSGGGGGHRHGGHRHGGGGFVAGAVAGALIGGIGSAIAAPRYYGGPGYYSAPGYYAPVYPAPVYYGAPYYDDSAIVIESAPVGDDAVAYCMQRFRSYDPRSGTYLGYDGYRHPCP
jgi:hypothetical protein